MAAWASLKGKRQADAQRDLGWSKASASNLWTGKQRYTQDLVDAAALWLGIRPFELLMQPDDAMAYREMRSAVATLAERSVSFDHEERVERSR